MAYVFDKAKADRVIEFIHRFCSITKGKKSRITLLPFQIELLSNIFGWIDEETGYRKVRKAYIEWAKKNGKSFIVSCICLYLLFADGEEGAEIYCASGNLEQAGIVFNECVKMIRANPFLRSESRITLAPSNQKIVVPRTNSVLRPLTEASITKEGFDISALIVDEIGNSVDRKLVDVLDLGTGSRKQPLTFMITTAGTYGNNIGWETHNHAKRILEKEIEEPTYYVDIKTIGKDDDWTKPETWYKANPGLQRPGIEGYTKTLIGLEESVRKAINAGSPYEISKVKKYQLNIWNQDTDAYFSMDKFNACMRDIEPEELRDKHFICALDLSATTDLTTAVLVSIPETEEEPYFVLSHFWIPEKTLIERERVEGVPYQDWIRNGWVFKCKGDVIDIRDIKRKIIELNGIHPLREIPYDRALSGRLIPELEEDGFLCIDFPQTLMKRSPHIKELNRLILSKKMIFQTNPCLAYCFENSMGKIDDKDNVELYKKSKTARIDGAIATVMGLARAQAQQEMNRKKFTGSLLALQWDD